MLLVKSAWIWTIQRKFILHYSIGSKAARDNVNQIAHVPKSRGSLGNNKHGGWSCDGVHSGLHSPGRWNSAIYYWNYSWVQTFHILCILFIQMTSKLWMLTFNVILGYQGLLFRDFLWYFVFSLFFSIRATDPISGNAFDAKRKKEGDGLTRNNQLQQIIW